MSDETKSPLQGTFFDDYTLKDPIEKGDKVIVDTGKTSTTKTEEEIAAAEKAEADKILADQKLEDAKSESYTDEELKTLADSIKEKEEDELEEDEKQFLADYQAGSLEDYKKPIEDNSSKGEGFDTLAKTLMEEGILTSGDDIEDSQESFSKAISDTVEAKVDEYLSEIPDDYKNIIDHLKSGGDANTYLQQKSSIDYAGLDLDDENIQEALVKADLEQQGYSAEDVEEKIQDYKDLEKLGKEAKVANKKFDAAQTERLQAYDKSIKDALEAQEISDLAEVEEVKKTIDDLKEIAGFKLTKKRKEDFKKYLFDLDENGETAATREQNENENRIKAHFMGFIGYNFKDMEKQVISKKTKDLGQLLNRFKDTQTGATGKVVKDMDPEPKFELNIPSMFNRDNSD